MIEDVEDLAEWLADAAGVWGSCPDAEKEGCAQKTYCRLCWVMEVKQRMREAVRGELEREKAGKKRCSNN